jgi:hypothetical protein
MILTVSPPPVSANREDGCDRCGVDDLGRPLRVADFAVSTPSGVVLLCRTHHVAYAVSISEGGLAVTSLPADTVPAG